MRLSLRAVLIGLIAFVAIGALVSTPAAIDKTKVNFEPGWCQTEGVSLTIEEATVDTRCAKEFSGTSWQLLLATGHQVRGTSARPGKKTWQYALTGAATHFSECGSAEAWVFVPPTESPETYQPKTRPKTQKCG